MAIILSNLTRSAIKNAVLVRSVQNLTRMSTVGHQQISVNKIQNKLEAAKLDNKLIRSSFSSSAASASVSHDHSRLWSLERALSAALVAVVPLAFITPNTYLDYALALSLVTHTHWGLEAIVVDYVRPKLFGPVIPKLAIGLTYLLSILTLAGLYYFNYSDVGLTQATMMFLKK